MVKVVLFALASLLIFGTSSQTYAAEVDLVDQDEEINKKNEKGQKVGKWIVFGKDNPEKGYPEEGKIEEGAYVSDRKDGTWIKYHKDGVTPRLIGEYSFGRPKGAFQKTWADGTPKEIGVYYNGKFSDSLIRIHQNGVESYRANYNEAGMEQGEVRYTYPNGQPEFVYTANNGIPTGEAIRYWENGDVKEIINYGADGKVVETSGEKPMVNPEVKIDSDEPAVKAPGIDGGDVQGEFKPNGYNKVYKNQEIWQDGEFKKGKLYDGKLYIYDEDGLLFKIEVYKEGKYHSDGQL